VNGRLKLGRHGGIEIPRERKGYVQINTHMRLVVYAKTLIVLQLLHRIGIRFTLGCVEGGQMVLVDAGIPTKRMLRENIDTKHH
jgi:hypothetical protein